MSYNHLCSPYSDQYAIYPNLSGLSPACILQRSLRLELLLCNCACFRITLANRFNTILVEGILLCACVTFVLQMHKWSSWTHSVLNQFANTTITQHECKWIKGGPALALLCCRHIAGNFIGIKQMEVSIRGISLSKLPPPCFLCLCTAY